MKRFPFLFRPVMGLVVVAASAIIGGCDNPPSQAPPWLKGTTPAGPEQAAAGPAAAATDDTLKTNILNELRSRKFKNEDFVESDANRDPFHCFISDFSGGPTIDTRQYDIVLSKFSLDELKLSMITSPRGGSTGGGPVKRQKNDPDCDLRPCAVFVDSAGLGVAVSRNFHISRADAKVVRIDPEKGQVFVEIKEDLGNGKFRVIERVLEMHQTLEGQTQ